MQLANIYFLDNFILKRPLLLKQASSSECL